MDISFHSHRLAQQPPAFFVVGCERHSNDLGKWVAAAPLPHDGLKVLCIALLECAVRSALVCMRTMCVHMTCWGRGAI
eukprot:431329-Pelagomonas_calceolata.AAC.2